MLYDEWNFDEYIAVQRKEAAQDAVAAARAEIEHRKAVTTAKAMLQDGVEHSKVAKYTGLPLEQVHQLQPQ